MRRFAGMGSGMMKNSLISIKGLLHTEHFWVVRLLVSQRSLSIPSEPVGTLYPEQATTGKTGYLGYFGSSKCF
tara:strand:- start:375 stop:593 length:219 start_codon:yes stop_codon:yes gene_type:complete